MKEDGIRLLGLEGGVPREGLIGEWGLKSRGVETLLGTGKNPPFYQQAGIAVPAQIYDWKAAPETRSQAQQVQERNREQFLRAFAADLAVLGYERVAERHGKLLLGIWVESRPYPSDQ